MIPVMRAMDAQIRDIAWDRMVFRKMCILVQLCANSSSKCMTVISSKLSSYPLALIRCISLKYERKLSISSEMNFTVTSLDIEIESRCKLFNLATFSAFKRKYIWDKKVLLRERQRHTARRVVSTPSIVLTGYPPHPDLAQGGYPAGGYPTWYPTWVPPSRVPPRQGSPLSWPGRIPSPPPQPAGPGWVPP